MTTPHASSPQLPPPDVNTRVLFAPPEALNTFRPSDAMAAPQHTDTRHLLSSVVGREVRADTADIEVQQKSEKAGITYTRGGLRIPSYVDRYFVFDGSGRQMFNADGTPMDVRDMDYKIGSKRPPHASYPMMVSVEGKPLVPASAADQRQNVRSRIGGVLYGVMDRRWDLQALESHRNSEEQKVVQKVVGTGPDNDERIVFAVHNVNGRLQKYDGTPLDRLNANIYHHQIKVARVNQSRFQAIAAYEIGKREEQEQGGGRGFWIQIVNTMHQELGYSKDQIPKVAVGLQYMKKATYLTFKHRSFDLFAADGTPIDTSACTPKQLEAYRQAGSYYKFGKLKERAFATELADKVVPYQYTFSAADVAEVYRLAERVSTRLEESRNRPNAIQYQNNTYILRKLKLAVDASRMGSLAEPGKDGPGPEEMSADARRLWEARVAQSAASAAAYPPRISGSAAANDMWRRMAEVVDAAAMQHPLWNELNINLEYPSNDF